MKSSSELGSKSGSWCKFERFYFKGDSLVGWQGIDIRLKLLLQLPTRTSRFFEDTKCSDIG